MPVGLYTDKKLLLLSRAAQYFHLHHLPAAQSILLPVLSGVFHHFSGQQALLLSESSSGRWPNSYAASIQVQT